MGGTLSRTPCASPRANWPVAVRAPEVDCSPRGEARQDQEALLQERPALQALPGRVQAAREAGARRAPRAAGLPGLRERRQEAAQGRSRALSARVLRANRSRSSRALTTAPAAPRIRNWGRTCAENRLAGELNIATPTITMSQTEPSVAATIRPSRVPATKIPAIARPPSAQAN